MRSRLSVPLTVVIFRYKFDVLKACLDHYLITTDNLSATAVAITSAYSTLNFKHCHTTASGD